jgi:hypothetical protein
MQVIILGRNHVKSKVGLYFIPDKDRMPCHPSAHYSQANKKKYQIQYYVFLPKIVIFTRPNSKHEYSGRQKKIYFSSDNHLGIYQEESKT